MHCTSQANVIYGKDANIRSIKSMSTANGCCGVCKATGGCESWTFHTNGTKAGLCYLHSAAGNPTPYKGVISGIVGLFATRLTHRITEADMAKFRIKKWTTVVPCSSH